MSYRNNGNRYFNQPTYQSNLNQQRPNNQTNPRPNSGGARPQTTGAKAFGSGGPFDRKAHYRRNSGGYNNKSKNNYNNSNNDNDYNYNYNSNNHRNVSNRWNDDKEKQEPLLESKEDHHPNDYAYRNSRRMPPSFSSRPGGSAYYPGANRRPSFQVDSGGRQQHESSPHGNRSHPDGSNDSAQVDNWGPKRKARGFVRGGRIAKRQRTEDYREEEVELYCNVCEKSFRDWQEKIAHDNSHGHALRVEDKRQENLEQAERWKNEEKLSTFSHPKSNPAFRHHHIQHITHQVKSSVSQPHSVEANADASAPSTDAGANGNEQSNNLVAINFLLHSQSQIIGSVDIPASFKKWGDKSLRAAREKAQRNKDPHIENLVREEVSFELIRAIKQSTLHRTNWERVLLCTGALMRRKACAPVLKMTTLEDILRKDAASKQRKLDAEKAAAIDLVSGDGQNNDKDNVIGDDNASLRGNGSVHTRATRQSANPPQWGSDGVINQDVPNPSLASDPTNSSTPLATPASTAPPNSTATELARARVAKKRQLRRKPPSALGERSRRIASGLMELHIESVLDYHPALAERAAQTRSANGSKKKAAPHDLKHYIDKYAKIVREMSVEGVADVAATRKELREIAEDLEGAHMSPRLVQECLKREIELALDANDLSMVAEPACQLMKSIDDYGSDIRSREAIPDPEFVIPIETYISIWFLSLLLRGAIQMRLSANVRGLTQSPTRALCEALRRLPKNALSLGSVHRCKNVVSALIRNDWISFFNLYKESTTTTDWDLDPKGFVNNMLVVYEPVVRQRAYMTMLARPEGSDLSVYMPNLLSLKWVMSVLGYPDYEPYSASEYDQLPESETNDPKPDDVLTEARKFVANLPSEIRVEGSAHEGRDIALHGTNDVGVIHDSKVINVPLLNKLMNNSMRIVDPVGF